MILKLQNVSVFFNKTIISEQVTLLGTNLLPDDGFIKKPKHFGILIS